MIAKARERLTADPGLGTSREAGVVEPGERMLLWCEGGPNVGRATHYPPPLEIHVDGGTYVLVDDGAPEQWRYISVSDGNAIR